MRSLVAKAAFIFAAALTAAPDARAQATVVAEDYALETVAAALRLCSAEEAAPGGAYAVGFCFGWLEGIGQMYEAIVLEPRFELNKFTCPQRELTREEIRTVFVDWARANPAEAGAPPLVGVAKSLKEAYPCT